MKTTPAALVLCVAIMTGCAASKPATTDRAESGPQTSKTMVIEVAPFKADCHGMMPMKCLIVDGDYFYSDIQGFEFIKGYRYKLEIQRIQQYTTDNVPADASLYHYRLIRVLEKTKVKK
ncbi:DUF4377 domain-containing protein [Spongorhabdus nitratireducens]